MLRNLAIITLGCSKNRVDSEHLLRQIQAAGVCVLSEDEFAQGGRVDMLIINTCGFIKDAKQESIDTILEAVQAKKAGRIQRIFVFGCLSQRYPKELAESIPEVDRFFGANEPESILKALDLKWLPAYACERVLSTPPHYAYLKISEGCDRSCAYCAIPLIRGPHHSVPQETLIQEATHLAAQGVKELLVVAQDTTFYGLDLYKRRALAPLMEQLAQIKGIEWIRLHYTYPAGFPEDVLELMAQHPKICSYLDIPLQHASSKVLSAMKRSIDGSQTRALVSHIRNKIPGICLRTTFIVGHPGEDARAFQELLDFVREARFERMGAFTYSEEEGTIAARTLKDAIREKTKQERYNKLMDIQSGISFAYNQSRMGTTERVLIDRAEDGRLVGRSQFESPEVDGEIYLSMPELARPHSGTTMIGSFQNAIIKTASEYDLYGELKVKNQ